MRQQESIDPPVNKDAIYVWVMVGSVVATLTAIILTYLELSEFYLTK